MSFFKKSVIKVTLESRENQEVELYALPASKIGVVTEISSEFNKVNKLEQEGKATAEDVNNIAKRMAEVVAEYSNIPTIEDVLELSLGEIGYLYAKLQSGSSNPKA